MADLASQFGNSEDFKTLLGLLQAEMQKAAQTSTTTVDIIEVDYDNEIQSRALSEAPFHRFLEEKGRVQNSTSAVIGWRRKENANVSRFTDELGLVSGSKPASTAKNWEKELEGMKVITYPIEVSLMAQMGNQNVDLVEDDRQDGYADILARKDKAFLLGDSAVDTNSFDGIAKVAGNKKDLNGAEISMAEVDDMIDKVIAKGGNPDGIVTTARVARQLTREQQLENLHIDKVEFVPGGWVRSYYTPNGEIPLMTDRNLVTLDEDGEIDPASEDILAVVDSKAVINKNLLPVSEFPFAMTRLATDSTLATFTAFGIMGPQKLGVINGIGDGS